MPDPPTERANGFGFGFGFDHLLSGLRDGRAGWGPRAGLSVAAAAAMIGLTLVVLGSLEINGVNLRDEHAAIFIPVCVAAWLAAVYLIWATFGRWKRLLRTVVVCLAIWAVTIGASILLDSARRNAEMAIGGLIMLALTANLIVIVSGVYHLTRGRPMFQDSGKLNIHCPACGYDMAGLDAGACPECGSKFTLEALIRAQDYEALRAARRPSAPAAPAPALPTAQPQHTPGAVTLVPADIAAMPVGS